MAGHWLEMWRLIDWRYDGSLDVDVTGSLVGDVTGSLVGAVTGSLVGDVSAHWLEMG